MNSSIINNPKNHASSALKPHLLRPQGSTQGLSRRVHSQGNINALTKFRNRSRGLNRLATAETRGDQQRTFRKRMSSDRSKTRIAFFCQIQKSSKLLSWIVESVNLKIQRDSCRSARHSVLTQCLLGAQGVTFGLYRRVLLEEIKR